MEDVLRYYADLLEYSQRFLRVPGIQVAVYAEAVSAEEGIVLSRAFGLADVAAGVELTERHLFRIASHSKTFTATAVLQLVEGGRLRLDDPAAAHVAELDGLPVGLLTVRDLLSHAGGLIRDSRNGDFWLLDDRFPDRDRLLEILRAPDTLVLPSNDRFKYSNIGYGLLGLIIEAVSGRSYSEYVQAEILDRLGLTDLGPDLDRNRLADYAVGHTALSYADQRVPIDHVETYALAAATGFYGTATDLVRYFAAHLPGDDRLLTEASKRLMRHPLWPTRTDSPLTETSLAPASDDQRYGLGLSIAKAGDRYTLGHGGGFPGQITRTLVDPDRRIIVAVLTNAVDGPAQSLAQLFLKLLDLAGCASRDDHTVDTVFPGRFANVWGVRDIASLGGKLYLLDPTVTDPTSEAFALEIVDDRTLRIVDGPGLGSLGEQISYDLRDDGTVRTIRGPSGQTYTPLDAFTLPDRITLRIT